jgi:hypothetical protein
MARFMPGARISQAHGTTGPVDPASGAPDATVFAMYHPAAALRSTAVERESYDDMGAVPRALLDARARRSAARQPVPVMAAEISGEIPGEIVGDADALPTPDLTIF